MLSLFLVALGTSFLLGMRHATDADHVVAVTAIASQERSLARAAGMGALWGIGHTITILLVGGAIVLFKLALTPRMGLSMEFTVAVMLVVLGLLNLFDVRLAPGRSPPCARSSWAWCTAWPARRPPRCSCSRSSATCAGRPRICSCSASAPSRAWRS
jgi:hypothetical protein